MSTPSATSGRGAAWAVLAVLAVLVVVVVAVAVRAGGAASAGTAPTAEATAPDETAEATEPADAPSLDAVARRDPADATAIGPVDAPVVLTAYSDYQCPYCALWADETLPALLPYVEDGTLRVEFRDIDSFGEDSLRAAQAAYAAGLQGAYLPYHAALFAGGETRSAGDLSADALIALAGEIGLDTAQFAADLAGSAVADGVGANTAEALSIGAYSTPAFVVNGTPIVGAQPAEVFVQAIEAAAAG